MKRIGFTIVLNGVHHLKHKDYAQYLIDNCLDHWIIVEGASQNDGSTYWVKGSHYMTDCDSEFHRNGSSVDGTVEYLKKLQKDNTKVKVIFPDGFRPWYSKDEMVNVAIEEIKKITSNCFLWQIDADEQWKLNDMVAAEKALLSSGIKTGAFYFNQYVGKNLVVKGTSWGCNTMNRLWIWNGEKFKSHEPAVLEGCNNYFVLLQKYEHYSYYFEQDVLFKAKWYYDDISIFENWKDLQKRKQFPVSLSKLFSGEQYNAYTTNAVIVDERSYTPNNTCDLIQCYFIHELESRRKEFLYCLEKNIANPFICNIHLFFYDFDSKYFGEIQCLKSDKVKIIPVTGGRNTYKLFTDYANKNLEGKNIIIANTDIWFDESLQLIDKIDLDNTLICLTRYEANNKNNISNADGCSHDSWIFKSPMIDFDNNIAMGVLGCDSMLHVNAVKAGLKLQCPSLDIKSYHEHSDLDHNSPTRNNKLSDGNCYWNHRDWQDILVLSCHINEETKIGYRK